MTQLIDGKAFADRLSRELADEVSALKRDHDLQPGIAVVLVGDDPASAVYVRNKIKRCHELGIASHEHRLAADTDEASLIALVKDLNGDPAVHGILVQLPLPAQIDDKAVIAAIDPDKDVDGFHVANAGALAVGDNRMVPCTPLGAMMLLKDTVGDLSGLHAVVIGRSNIVGKPMAALLLQAHCTVSIAHSRTADLPGLCRQADILVAAVGIAQFVKADWVKAGATVIDVGINRIEQDGKKRLVGDVDFDAVAPVASAITPVPGGIGPMTIACLMHNTVTAAKRSRGLL
ncbi:MAG: bifunctional methylenetetrahydrofolate dehydrogenase/methenyltetrahydrofolate cyclohydrolase FolD [Pseudomonadota bacterium]